MSHSSFNHNENMACPVRKCLPYGSSQPRYYINGYRNGGPLLRPINLIIVVLFLKTVVSLLDETVDEPTIVLKSITGANGEDLRGGSAEGRRGVNHKEAVTMVVGYVQVLLSVLTNFYCLIRENYKTY